jgi:Flp pilus assembly protein TadG
MRRRLSLHIRGLTLGQAVAEFALIVPIFILMLLIAVDFGRLFFTYIQVNNAAREAANYAAAHAVDYANGTTTYSQFHDSSISAGLAEANVQTQPGAGTAMAFASPTCFSPGPPVATIDCADAPQNGTSASGIGNQVSVTVTQQFSFLTPFLNTFFGGGLTMNATATATVLNPLVAQVLQPSPSPGASAGASSPPSTAPSSAPSSPPSAAPTAAPIFCTVPDFKNGFWSNVGGITATQVWTNAGFTGTLSGSSSVVNGGQQIQTQTLTAGASKVCTSNMSVDKN